MQYLGVSLCALCDPVQFDTCQKKFAKDIGLDQSIDWKRPLDLAMGIQVNKTEKTKLLERFKFFC